MKGLTVSPLLVTRREDGSPIAAGRLARPGLVIALLFTVAGCVARASVAPGPPGEAGGGGAAVWFRDELYFGAEMPTGAVVTDEEWERFLGEVITRRFPDGVTVLNGWGQYRYADGRIGRERTSVVIGFRVFTCFRPWKSGAGEGLLAIPGFSPGLRS
ncbi:MAG: DUF3574 domain-containing protein [Gemmatimonadetes bacterium]|nr:DUF3574 domain-containing protein [Gemmatimonadota bacterium]